MKRWYDIKNIAASEAEILIYDEIGGFGVGAESFLRELDTITAPVINLRVNSEGGEVFDGFAIYNALRRHPARIISHVDGMAASAATYPVLAGEEVRIAKNGFMMIHNPISLVMGESGDMRSEAEFLDKLSGIIANIYVERTGKPLAQVLQWMSEETWFTADECLAEGFADVLSDQEADAEVVSNRRRHVLNCAAAKRTSITNRVKALGLDTVLRPKPVNAPTPKGNTMTREEIISAAQSWVDAEDIMSVTLTFSDEDVVAVEKAAPDTESPEPENRRRNATVTKVRPVLLPKNATAGELKAAFPEDREFVMDRLDVDAPLPDHKIAYADRLKVQNKAVRDELTQLRAELAKHDPSSAGRQPVNTGTPTGDGGTRTTTPERKNELRRMTGLKPVN